MVGKKSSDEPRVSAARKVRLWIIAGLILLLAIFVFQNSREVQVEFIFADTTTPLFWALIVSALIGMGIGWLLPRIGRKK